jgi:hypothetical protein
MAGASNTQEARRLNDLEAWQRMPRLMAFAVADLPDAATYERCLIYVSDETSGPTIAFSDGTDWRRVQDRAVVS